MTTTVIDAAALEEARRLLRRAGPMVAAIFEEAARIVDGEPPVVGCRERIECLADESRASIRAALAALDKSEAL